ncbi:MAG: type II toxin-antitoxin system RelE/ParE family toxin [Nanoarchaeota archaeon]
MYEVEFSKKAEKQFIKLERIHKERIISALERIRIRPEPFLTKLVGNDAYRLKVGDYRVIIDLYRDKLIILVIGIGHRKNVYDKL